MNGVHITRPFEQDPRRLQSLKDAVAANREGETLEAVVSVVGSRKAQQAVQEHSLDSLVAELNGHA